MRMIRWMNGKTRKDRIRNEYIRNSLGVAQIEDEIREKHLRRFGHDIGGQSLRQAVQREATVFKRPLKRKRETKETALEMIIMT